jgi:arsenite/tail-anchored protein-transporting ATPase
VFYDVQRLVRNLIAMNEILRDRERASIRLVMNPDRMVIKEAQRTFTYLNLYGYLTDAVVVNRVFPEDVEGGYFGRWRERQRDQLLRVSEGFAPVPMLTARYFDTEVAGAQMLDRLAAELFEDEAPHHVLHSELAHELVTHDGRTVLRLRIPFTDKSEIRLGKVGAELIVSAGREKRTIILPSALSERQPTGASFEGDTLNVSFEDGRPVRPQTARGPDRSDGSSGHGPEPKAVGPEGERAAQRA